MTTHKTTTAKEDKDKWATPFWAFRFARKWFGFPQFDIDCAASAHNTKCEKLPLNSTSKRNGQKEFINEDNKMNLVLIFLILSMAVNIILVFDSKQLFKKLKKEQEKNKGLLSQIEIKEIYLKNYENRITENRELAR